VVVDVLRTKTVERGMVKYNHINVKAPLATAFQSVGQNTVATIVSYGALAGLTSVILVLLIGQSRVFFAMSRDRLLPPVFSAVSQRFRTPYRTTIATGLAVAALTFFLSLKTLAELVNIGTLFALRVGRRDHAAPHATRPRAPVPRAADAADPDPVGAGLGVADAEPPDRDVDPVRGVDGGRAGGVLRLLDAPQPASRSPLDSGYIRSTR
jgi:hypothetical protein